MADGFSYLSYPPPFFGTHILMNSSICMDVFEAGDDVRSLPCLHRFHVACVDRWLTQHAATCPVCKMPILDNNGNNGGR